MYAAVHAFDFASTNRVTVSNIFGCLVSMVVYTTSKFLFDCDVDLNSTTEKILFINPCVLRQRYELCKLKDVIWIPFKANPADAMTELSSSDALTTLLKKKEI